MARNPWIGMMLALLLLPASALARPDIDALLDFGQTDNIMNAAWSGDTKDDTFMDLSLGISGMLRTGHHTALSLRLGAGERRYSDYPLLDNRRLDSTLRLAWLTGTGFYSPTLTLSLGGGATRVESEQRNSTTARARLSLDQRLTTRIAYRASLGAEARSAEDPVFSYSRRSLDAFIDWNVLTHTALYLEVGAAEGNEVVSTRQMNADLSSAADRSVIDTAFGDSVTAYRIDADSLRYGLGLNCSLSNAWSLDLRYGCVESEAYGGARYDRCTGRLGLLFLLSG